ncbi:substrate-binding domain-containing protein, partial [Catenulispora rubra]|uniref:substrate-binding domain-containing protein n=1 Tax=Catenulispora rubra TaxID=280293 RepID=UPI001E4EDC2E
MSETPESGEVADVEGVAGAVAGAVGMVWDADGGVGVDADGGGDGNGAGGGARVGAGRRDPLLVDVFTGIRRRLSATGTDLVMLAAARPQDGVDAYVDAAHRHGLDGVIVMGVDEGHPALTALTASGLACVAVDLPLYRNRTTYVASDHRAGAASAVGYLHGLGHRAIATVTGPLSLMPTVERLVGYRFEMARTGTAVRAEYVVSGEYTEESGYECARRLMALAEPPTAVFAADDRMAVGVLRALGDLGVAVPGEVSVVGFDDVEAASLVRPGLTTVAQDHAGIGAGAVELL